MKPKVTILALLLLSQACGSSPSIDKLDPRSGPPGTEVVLHGQDFDCDHAVVSAILPKTKQRLPLQMNSCSPTEISAVVEGFSGDERMAIQLVVTGTTESNHKKFKMDPPFIDVEPGIFQDVLRDTMWLVETGFAERTWLNAINHCETIEGAGYDDWVLPALINFEEQEVAHYPFWDRLGKVEYWTSTAREDGNHLRVSTYGYDLRNVFGEKGNNINSTPYVPSCIEPEFAYVCARGAAITFEFDYLEAVDVAEYANTCQ